MQCPKCGKPISEFHLRDPGPSTFKCHFCGWNSDDEKGSDGLFDLEPKCPECGMPLSVKRNDPGPNLYKCYACKWQGTNPYKSTYVQIQDTKAQAEVQKWLAMLEATKQLALEASTAEGNRDEYYRHHGRMQKGNKLSKRQEWYGEYKYWMGVADALGRLNDIFTGRSLNDEKEDAVGMAEKPEQVCPSCSRPTLVPVTGGPHSNSSHCVLCGWDGAIPNVPF